MPTLSEERDRAICRILETNPTELEGVLDLSRQTISKRIDENKLFGVEEVLKVASEKIPDETVRSRIVANILNDWFPEIVRYTRDTDVGRFSKYNIGGMHIHAELASNPVFERFVRAILSDESKFVLFVCRPQKEHTQLTRWLKDFQRERGDNTASFAILPCKQVELSPIQIVAEPWSSDPKSGGPKLIQLTRDHLFVDEQNSERAVQLAGALMEYGLSERVCESIDDEAVLTNLINNLNSSFYEKSQIDQSDCLRFVNRSARARRARDGDSVVQASSTS